MKIKEPIYPIEPWTVTETEFTVEHNYRNETTFSLSNGYIGTRGTLEEAYDFDIHTGLEGNFINGFYESETIRYGEANFGSPQLSQSLLNLPNLKEIQLILDDEIFDMRTGQIEEYKRVLHMKEGILKRSLIWISPKGKKIRLLTERFASFEDKNILVTKYWIYSYNYTGPITLISRLNADVENHTRKTNPIVDYGPFGRRLTPSAIYARDHMLFYQGTAKGSGLTMACGSIHKINTDSTTAFHTEELKAEVRYQTEIAEEGSIELEKYICYTSDLDMEAGLLENFVIDTLHAAQRKGYTAQESRQKDYVANFWECADINIKGDEALLQGIRFNLFHIMQSAGRDGTTGMGAKGLSGEGYEGHYFWDTEMYILPVFIYTNPELAKGLLDYRYHTLNKARERARILGHRKGALYPWRTINGEEASTYFPLGTAQYHINADIAYALQLYINVTGDMAYLEEKGAEILIETARIWADVGSFAECKGGKYCICSVTGPDEYNVLVDNNFYTNLMARENLRDACNAVEYLKLNKPKQYQKIVRKLDFLADELDLWKKIIENMYFPYDEKNQIYPLDDGFMMRKPWDESVIPPEKRAWLYENYHPLFIMRHRMSKQADSILGMYLHSNYFTPEQLRRNYDFYQQVTLHHSSLSTCIFGILACEIGYYEEAFQYFSQSARMDLDDYHNNFYAGIHAANMAGTWQAVVNGFAGVRVNSGVLTFKPYIPETWESYEFKLTYRTCVLQIYIDQKQASFQLVKGQEIVFCVGDNKVQLNKEGDCYLEKI